jgi:hypothetical protein
MGQKQGDLDNPYSLVIHGQNIPSNMDHTITHESLNPSKSQKEQIKKRWKPVNENLLTTQDPMKIKPFNSTERNISSIFASQQMESLANANKSTLKTGEISQPNMKPTLMQNQDSSQSKPD